jgi:YOP proteins translocation protein K (YscK)
MPRSQGDALPLASGESSSTELAFYPNRYLDASWRQEMLPGAVWSLLSSPRTEGRLARYVEKQAGLKPFLPTVRFDSPKVRFCLLPSPALTRIAAWAGLATNAEFLRRLIDAPSVSRLRRELSPEAYEFVLRRAPLLTRSNSPLPPDLSSDAPLAEQLEHSGANHIALAVADLDAHFRARLALKLHKRHATVLGAPRGTLQAEGAWQVLLKIIREVEPECSALLA